MFNMNRQNTITALTGYIEGCFQQPSMQSQHLSGAGATFLLEEKLRKYYNKKFTVLFSSATTALQAVCIALELHNTEIITSPINWGGSIAPFLLHRNNLRFVSFDPYSLNLSISDLPSGITAKAKAVLSVDFNGTPADSKAIKRFCSEHGLKYISDSAQSFGAYRDKKPAGFFADAIILSFSPGKSLFGFEGGAAITDDEKLYEKLIWYSQHPSKQKAVFGISNYNEYAPINGRIHPVTALYLTEIFEASLSELKKYQTKCFQLLIQLQNEKLVEATKHISSAEATTFFNFSIRLKSNVNVNQVNDFLKQTDKSFTTMHSFPKLIPFDASFRKQFRRKFSCSDKLLKQELLIQQRNQVTLIYSP